MKCLKKIFNDFFQKFNHYVIEEVEVSFLFQLKDLFLNQNRSQLKIF